jgi:RNA polymerase sigma factor (sigma-70 family)
MAESTLTEFLDRLRWSLRLRGEAESPDTELLQRFLEGREETAFAALVERHGPMVLSVCRNMVQNAADADDAFQATFMVLVRRAASIRKPQLLGNWLYGVAHRVAARARAQAARRRARERSEVEMLAADPHRVNNEWNPVLHEELNRLPEKYRAPMVLCYLQGMTNQEAARLLAWPVGTVKGRLTRARELLRKRLTRRGVVLSSAFLTAALGTSTISAGVPAALVNSTVRAAMLVAAGPVAATGLSASVVALTQGVLRIMLLTRLTTVFGMAAGVGLLGATVALVTHQALAAGGEPEPALARSEPSAGVQDQPQQDDPKRREADEAEERAQRHSMDNLKRLALGMHNYVSDHGQFPPAAVYSKEGKPLLSWRVLLLPYLDQRDLYSRFKLDEPWDGPTNKKLLDKMPAIYSFTPDKPKEPGKTIYQVFTGVETVFPNPNASRIADITDGTSNTILIVEAAAAVPWTQPADLPYDPKKPLPNLGGVTKMGIQAAFADGSGRILKPTIKEATLRALITRNGGEVIDPNEL